MTEAVVVPQLGRRLLAEHVDELAAELTGLIVDTVPDYADADPADLAGSCRRNLTRSLQSLSGDLPTPGDLVDAPAETGRLRAQQGVPLESLLRAYRLGGRVLWEALVREARREPQADVDPQRLLDVATALWRVIDEHSAAVSRSYREEQQRLADQGLRRQQALLDALIQGTDASSAVVADAAECLQVPADVDVLVVVGAYEPGDREPLRAPHDALVLRGAPSWWRVRAGREVGLVAVPADGEALVVEALRGCAVGRVAVSPVVRGLASVAEAFRLAETALATLPRDHVGVARLRERLPEALVVTNPEVRRQLVDTALRPLLALRPREREALLSTLEAVLACGGSPTRAAARLYCHRNTVLKRLQRVEQLTGTSLGRPRERLVLELAVLAHRLDGWSSPVSPLPAGSSPAVRRGRPALPAS